MKTNIYLFGDSHCKCFVHDHYNNGVVHSSDFTLYNKFKSTTSARGVVNNKSKKQYGPYIIQTLKNIRHSKDLYNICVLKLGQVDIEYNYYYKVYYKNENINKQDFYIDTVEKYITFVKFLKQSFSDINFIVNGVNMPNVYDLQEYMAREKAIIPPITYEERFDDHYRFNSLLQDKCTLEGIKYFDLTLETTNNKLLKSEFIGSDNHLAGGDYVNINTMNVFVGKLIKTISK
jgi:hypothetical protein